MLQGAATGVVPDTYGDANNVGQFTVDTTGRITFAQNVPIVGAGSTPAGANEEIQFNNNGVFGASANLTWDGVELYANTVGTRGLVVNDGRNAANGGLIFSTTGTGLGQTLIYNFYANRAFDIYTTATSPITFRNASSGTGDMVRMLPGGAVEIYYNGSKKLETTNTGISVTGNVNATGNVKATAGQLQVSNSAQPAFVTGFQAPLAFTQSVVYRLPPADGSSGQVLSTNGSGILSWVSSGGGSAAGANTQIQFNNNGVLGASPNLTWDGTNLGSNGTMSSGTMFALNFVASTDPFGNGRKFTFGGGSGDLVLTTNPTVTNYTLTLPDSQGGAGTVLQNDGSGNLSWVAGATVVAAPTASGDPGNAGEVAYDSTYFYWYDGGGWQRVAADTTPW